MLQGEGEGSITWWVRGLVQARNATRAKKVTTDPLTDDVTEVLPADRQGRLGDR